MSNQHTKNNLGLGEYSPRRQFRFSEEQDRKFMRDAKWAMDSFGCTSPSHYARCKLGLEAWPGDAIAADTTPVKVPRKRTKVAR